MSDDTRKKKSGVAVGYGSAAPQHLVDRARAIMAGLTGVPEQDVEVIALPDVQTTPAGPMEPEEDEDVVRDQRDRAVALLRKLATIGDAAAECRKCADAEVGPDGKVVTRPGESGERPVMVARQDGLEVPQLFNPAKGEGQCPRCGRAAYFAADDLENDVGKLAMEAGALLAEVDGSTAG